MTHPDQLPPQPDYPEIASRGAIASPPDCLGAVSATAEPDPALRAASDLAWIGRLRFIETDQEAVLLVSMRHFGGQHWMVTARAAEMVPARMRTVLNRICLPAGGERNERSHFYSPDLARAALADCRCDLLRDGARGRFRWLVRPALPRVQPA